MSNQKTETGRYAGAQMEYPSSNALLNKQLHSHPASCSSHHWRDEMFAQKADVLRKPAATLQSDRMLPPCNRDGIPEDYPRHRCWYWLTLGVGSVVDLLRVETTKGATTRERHQTPHPSLDSCGERR
jgi:hypothetical protein